MLAHIFYVSKSTFAPYNSVDQDILLQARKRNPTLDLTGCLFRAPNLYAQILEGPRESIDQVMVRIRVDSRHYDIIEWQPTETANRFFSDWSMGYATKEIADAQLSAFAAAKQRAIAEIAGVLRNVFDTEYDKSKP